MLHPGVDGLQRAVVRTEMSPRTDQGCTWRDRGDTQQPTMDADIRFSKRHPWPRAEGEVLRPRALPCIVRHRGKAPERSSELSAAACGAAATLWLSPRPPAPAAGDD
jgi:hypothetical protein